MEQVLLSHVAVKRLQVQNVTKSAHKCWKNNVILPWHKSSFFIVFPHVKFPLPLAQGNFATLAAKAALHGKMVVQLLAKPDFGLHGNNLSESRNMLHISWNCRDQKHYTEKETPCSLSCKRGCIPLSNNTKVWGKLETRLYSDLSWWSLKASRPVLTG